MRSVTNLPAEEDNTVVRCWVYIYNSFNSSVQGLAEQKSLMEGIDIVFKNWRKEKKIP